MHLAFAAFVLLGGVLVLGWPLGGVVLLINVAVYETALHRRGRR